MDTIQNNQPLENRPKRALAVGLGGAGAAVIRALADQPGAKWLKTAVIDTDNSSLTSVPNADFELAAASDWVLCNGTGCGGDIIRGERALARERTNLTKLFRGYDLILVAAGLGGGTATGGIRIIASVIRQLGIRSFFLVTTPFSFESYNRKKNAESSISELLPLADILLTMPNDLLFSRLPPDAPIEQAFDLAAKEMARTLSGFASVLRSRSVIGSDYAVFMNALRGRRAVCGAGVGRAAAADGLDRCSLSLERMLESPFLGGPDKLKEADALMLILSGGPDLEMAEMKRVLEQTSAIAAGPELIVGVSIDEELCGTVQMTAVSVIYEEKNEPNASWRQSSGTGPGTLSQTVRKNADLFGVADSPKKRTHSKAKSQIQDELFPMEQEEFPLMSYSRGIFKDYPPSMYGDDDLDIPTFQRKNVTVNKGSR